MTDLTLDDIAPLRNSLWTENDSGMTHWEGCWEVHPWCAVARLLPLAELALSGEKREQWGVKWPESDEPIPCSQQTAKWHAKRGTAMLRHRTVTTITGPWEPVEETPNG